MEKKTAVDFLFEVWNSREPFDKFILDEQFEEAKKMEKQQIEKSFDIGFHRGHECGENHDWHEGQNRGSEYYQQEYLGKQKINTEN